MPLFQIGYRRYEGGRTPRWLRWWPITRAGVTIAWRSKLLRRLVYASFLPFLYFGWVFFVIGRITDPGGEFGEGPFDAMAVALLGQDLVLQLHQDPGTVRTAVWSAVFASFTTVFQLLVGALVAAIVGPRLVASDLRSRAFLIYFARPLSRLDYVIGKSGVLIALLGAVSLLPSLGLYAFSILFSPSLDTLTQTLPVLLSLTLASLASIVATALLVLAISSLTTQPRFAAVTWVVVCTFGPIAHSVLQQTRGLRDAGWTFLVSFPHTIRALQLGIYGVDRRASQLGVQGNLHELVQGLASEDSPKLAALALLVLSVSCLLLLLRRVDAPTRV